MVRFFDASQRAAPKDTQYFMQLHELAKQHPLERLYKDFVGIYLKTGKTIERAVLDAIYKLSNKYGLDGPEIQILFTIIYAGMVAEEYRTSTKLGKRVKRLGVFQVLIEKLSPSVAAEFSKGKQWRAISAECEKRGF